MARRLVKSNDKKLFGVAGGVAEYFDVDPILVRVGFVVLALCFGGIGLVGYVALAILMPAPATPVPASPSDQQPSDTTEASEIRRRNNLLPWALLGLGAIILAAKFIVFSWTSWTLAAAALIGVGLVMLSRQSRPS